MHFVGQSTYYIQSGKYSSPGQIIFISTKIKRTLLAERVVGRIVKTKVVLLWRLISYDAASALSISVCCSVPWLAYL